MIIIQNRTLTSFSIAKDYFNKVLIENLNKAIKEIEKNRKNRSFDYT